MTIKSSIDNVELAKFNKTHDEWWDKEGEFRILHQINPIRINYLVDKAVKHFNIKNNSLPLSGLSVVDVGCGGGIAASALYELGAAVTAIDANGHNIKAARHYANQNNLDINFINQTVEEHVTKHQELYDIVVCFEVIEHVANPAEFIANLTSLIKPGGMMIISTINRSVKSYLLAIIMAERILGWIPKDTHDYNKLVKPSELKRFLNATGKQIKELKGLRLDIPCGGWLLCDDIDVNYFAYVA